MKTNQSTNPDSNSNDDHKVAKNHGDVGWVVNGDMIPRILHRLIHFPPNSIQF